MDIYSTRAQLKALELMPREYSFLYDTFCQDMGVVEDDRAIYDFRKGQDQMAPVVTEGTGGVLMGRTGYETREIGFCTVAPERIITIQDIKGRMFGEDILGAMTPEERERKVLVRDLQDMRKAIQLRREHMARQVLLTGNLEVFRYTNEGRDKETTKLANYGFTNRFTPTNAWNTASADIMSDMHTIYDMVYDGLGNVEIMVMAPDVYKTIRENSKYMVDFDRKNELAGEIQTRYAGSGVRVLGWNDDGVLMVSLSGTYLDDDGLRKPILPSGTLICGGKGILKAVHGPVTQVESTGMDSRHKTYIKKEVPLRYGSVDGNSIKNRLTSCPTIVPFNVDAWVVADVL